MRFQHQLLLRPIFPVKAAKDNKERKNAFELLEDHIDKNLIVQFMKNSSESDTPGIPDEINVVKDL